MIRWNLVAAHSIWICLVTNHCSIYDIELFKIQHIWFPKIVRKVWKYSVGDIIMSIIQCCWTISLMYIWAILSRASGCETDRNSRNKMRPKIYRQYTICNSMPRYISLDLSPRLQFHIIPFCCRGSLSFHEISTICQNIFGFENVLCCTVRF